MTLVCLYRLSLHIICPNICYNILSFVIINCDYAHLPVKNPSRFSPPWTYLTETSDSTKAWSSLVDAVKSIDDSMEIVELTDDCKYTASIMSSVLVRSQINTAIHSIY